MGDKTEHQDLFADGILPWADRVRSGALSFAQTIENCLSRVDDNQSLNAFECLDGERALATAVALDALLAEGTDLGPLMGLPMGVKDIMAVDGLPTTNGSNADTAAITGPQGSLITALRRAGLITLGKTRTVEFALGATGVNTSRGTPWNPVDREVHRIPGGSSSGSAVATASGMVGLGLGSDTGGSIRIPASFTGIVGYKSSVGIWPLDGIFPLSPTLDSAGPLCRTVQDAGLLHTLLTGESVIARPNVKGLRFGIVEELFQDDLDAQVADDFEQACQLLEQHGATRVSLSFPEVHERTSLFTAIVPAELIKTLTPERFESIRQSVDPVTESRAAVGMAMPAHEYVRAQLRRQQLVAKANATFNQVDVWLSPTCPFVPMPLKNLDTPEGHERALMASRNTQPGNLLDMCGLSLPMHRSAESGNLPSSRPSHLPSGLQLTMPLNHDRRLLATGMAVEQLLRNRR